MPLVMNALDTERSVCAQGNWFTWKPKQIKNIGSDDLALFFTSNLAHEGLVRIPDAFEEPDYRLTEEGKKELAEASAKGLNARIAFLDSVISNELVSLKRDLSRNNDQTDPRAYMHPNMIKNMEELAGYKRKQTAAKEEKISKIAELEKMIKG
jgi:hypothetical protein